MNTANPLFPAKNVDLRQIVYEKIKEAIVEGIIRPGEKLSEVELANKMAVSRTPVREAIRQLAQTGLVTLAPRKGAFVTVPTLSDATALYELRADLEMFAVSLVCIAPPKEELHRYREIFSATDSTSDVQEYLREDRNFHFCLYEASGNHFLRSVLLDIIDMINLYRPYSITGPSYLDVLAKGHVAIIDAVLEHDIDRARREMKDHIEINKMRVMDFLKSHPEIVPLQTI